MGTFTPVARPLTFGGNPMQALAISVLAQRGLGPSAALQRVLCQQSAHVARCRHRASRRPLTLRL